MSFFGVDYKLERNDNFDGFLKAVGVSDEKIKIITSSKSIAKIVKNGDSYVMSTTAGQKTKETPFKSGVEFDDVIGVDNYPVKSIITVEGNVITQTMKGSLGTTVFKSEFNGNELVVTITSDKFDGVAKRYYKA